MNALTNASEILAQVKQQLRLTNNDADRWLRSMISQRSRDLNTNETLIIKNCKVKTENNKFYLPEDCKRILAFRVNCIEGIFIDVPFFTNCGCNVQYGNSLINVIDINGRWANFMNTIPDDTDVEISYQAVYTIDGQVVINEEAYTAISNYVAFQYATAYPELYTPEQRSLWRMDGVYQGARVRSAAARRKYEQDKIQIQNRMNQMVNGNAPLQMISGIYNVNSFFFPTIR